MSKVTKLPPGFQARKVIGADGVQIVPGDHVVVCSVQGALSWGIFMGIQHLPGKKNAYGRTGRETRRMYYHNVDKQGQINGRKFINTYSLSSSDRILKR